MSSAKSRSAIKASGLSASFPNIEVFLNCERKVSSFSEACSRDVYENVRRQRRSASEVGRTGRLAESNA